MGAFNFEGIQGSWELTGKDLLPRFHKVDGKGLSIVDYLKKLDRAGIKTVAAIKTLGEEIFDRHPTDKKNRRVLEPIFEGMRAMM
ncbi:MAG TPA: hypothetical protein VFR09_08235 [Alphaproteobacteria bacterium]|nr:hypothetical protein [Alphaproteobacteria bacterium]